MQSRFNRTLCGLINKWRLATGRYDWNKILDDMVNNYNKTYQHITSFCYAKQDKNKRSPTHHKKDLHRIVGIGILLR